MTARTEQRLAPASLSRVVKVVLVDVGIPYLAYLALTRFGLSAVVALAAAGGVSVVRVVIGYARHHVISALSVLVIARFGLGVVLGVISGDARIVLIKDSLVTGSVGVVALVSLVLAKPMTYYIRRDFGGDRNAWDAAWSRSPRFRQVSRNTTAVWVVGLISESVVRAGFAFWTPLDLAILVCPAIGAGSIFLLIAWTQWYGRVTQESIDRELVAGQA